MRAREPLPTTYSAQDDILQREEVAVKPTKAKLSTIARILGGILILIATISSFVLYSNAPSGTQESIMPNAISTNQTTTTSKNTTSTAQTPITAKPNEYQADEAITASQMFAMEHGGDFVGHLYERGFTTNDLESFTQIDWDCTSIAYRWSIKKEENLKGLIEYYSITYPEQAKKWANEAIRLGWTKETPITYLCYIDHGLTWFML